jgi:hypothetical protein
MRLNDLTTQVLELPIADRAVLARLLWESLDESQASPTADTVVMAVALAQQRGAELDSGAAVPIAHEDVMSAARQALKCE